MKALIHHGEGKSGLRIGEMEVPEPKAGEVRVKLRASGLNHRDLFVLNRHLPDQPPLVIGSDGAGIIDKAGPEVTAVKVGDRVIINPGLGWKRNSPAPPPEFEIVGLPDHGTFAGYIILPEENVIPKPAYLSWEEAGVLSLAGLTAYRALFTRAKLKKNMTLLIPGIGSGVATFLLQFAKAHGAHVIVTSRSKHKRKKALEWGADQAIDTESDWEEAIGEKVDVVIDCVGAATIRKSFKQLKAGGTIVTFGSSTGDEINFNLREFFYGQYNFLGSTMGSAEEYLEMVRFCEKHQIKPVIDSVFRLEEYNQAFHKLERAEQLGKIAFIHS
ncbi:MAG: zinc-binding dehydrogenase [Bacillus sp. (in: firmicutes)]